MSFFFQDLRFGIRLACRRPAFTALVVTVLALGIGANTAIFSVVYGVILRPLEYPQPERLFRVFHRALDGAYEFGGVTPGNYTRWAENDAFQDLAAFYSTASTLTGYGQPRRLSGVVSDGNLLGVVGVPPQIGRTFRPEDDRPEAEPVVIISFSLWQGLFEGRNSALGEVLTLNGRAYSVVGVMPAGFSFPSRETDYWVPSGWSHEFRHNHFEYWMRILGRLKPGISRTAAEAELETVMAALRAEFPDENGNVGVQVVSLHEQLVTDVRSRLLILTTAVAFVLIIACVNLASLFLARATRRRREAALRQALGATRIRLLRLALTETLLVGLVGAALGLLLGWFFLRLLVSLVLQELPRLESVGIHPQVFFFTALAGVLSGIVAGTLPALHCSRVPSAGVLREGRGTSSNLALRRSLVIAQVALALVLLAGAGLLIRSLSQLNAVDPGFKSDQLLSFRVSLPGQAYDDSARRRFFREAEQRLNNLPGVVAAGAITNLPVTGINNSAWFNIVGRPVAPGTTPPSVLYRIVTPGYFNTLGIPLLQGRLPLPTDSRESSPVVVVNQALVDTYFPGDSPLGQEVVLGPLEEEVINPPSQIVGVVQNVRTVALERNHSPVVYLPHSVAPQWSSLVFVLRTQIDALAVMPAARTEIAALDPQLPIYQIATVEEVIGRSLGPYRSALVLFGIFALFALGLAALGVFGLLSYTVTQRRRELGIHLALGADRLRLSGMVLRDGLLQGLIGVALGLAGAFLLTRFLTGMLYQVSPLDPATLVGVSIILLLVTVAASLFPAHRAGRLDPVTCLRQE